MQSVLDRLIEKIILAPIDVEPTENIYIENIFDPTLYQQILRHLPEDAAYDDIEHPDAVLPDGRRTRKLLDLTPATLNKLTPEQRDFWSALAPVFTSTALRDMIIKKFSRSIQQRFGSQLPELVTVPIFYRDYPGYFISVHTDAPFKIATMQFYLPRDESQVHLGTSFHRHVNNEFPEIKRNPFKPNSAYAFVRTDSSWHSVRQLSATEKKRDSLALTIYLKGQEYQSDKVYR